MEKILKAINVGQGDCFLLRPCKCMYENSVFVIDTGNGRCDYTKALLQDEDIYVILTHAHADHINGFNLLMSSNKFQKVKSVILPYYHNESVLIAEALLNLKGMNTLSDTRGLKEQLNQVIQNQRVLFNLKDRIEIKFVKEGDILCRHIQIFNPECQYNDYLNELDNDAIREISELFIGNFSSEIKRILLDFKEGRYYNSEKYLYLDNLFLEHEEERKITRNRLNFFVGFLIENREELIKFNSNPSTMQLYKLIQKKKKKEHEVCIVFKCYYKGKIFLFTGDAELSVFNRLIKGNIKADYLKLPHHGSKRNISEKVLKAIDPEVVIISHNNGLFGRAKDPHPNIPTLDLIEKYKIKMIVTNDIEKVGSSVWPLKKDNPIDDNVEVIDV